jgi:hypothetical protein
MGADKNYSRRSNSAYAPNSQPSIPIRVCQGHIVTTDLPTQGTNSKQSRRGSMTQEAKDIVVLQTTRWTVRRARANSSQALGRQFATLGRTFRKRQQNLQYCTSNNGWSAPCPWTVREQQMPRGRCGAPTQMVQQTTCSKTLTPRRIYVRARKNWMNTRRTQTARTVHGLQADSPPGTNRTTQASNCEVNLSYPSMDIPNGLSS